MHFSETVKHYLGWCPNSSALHPVQTVITTPPAAVHPVQPDGEAGGSGRIDLGFNLFFGSIRILFRNRQLFWFLFLTGFVLLFNLITTIALQFFSGTDPLTGGSLVASSSTTLIAKGSPVWYALTSACQLITAFCALFLMVGLIICVSHLLSGRNTTFREGIANARSHIGSIGGWAVAFVMIGTAQSAIANLYQESSVVFISRFIVVPLCLGMLFVITILVFEEKSLIGAIEESISLFQKTWGEILLLCFFFVLFFFAVALVSLLPIVGIGFPSGDRVSLGITVALYEFVLLIAIMIGTIMMGILLTGLYTFAKTGKIPEAFLRVEGIGTVN